MGLQRVFRELGELQPVLRGRFIGLGGNLTALSAKRRYIDEDLNRNWSPARIEELRNGRQPEQRNTEDRELIGLLDEIERDVADAQDQVYIVDLHTTSGESPPFATIGDTLRNRRFALHFPVPIVLGLEEHLDHTMLEYLNSFGHITMGYEGGQHDDPAAVDHIEAGVWIALSAAGLIGASNQPTQVARSRKLLSKASEGLPRVVEVRYRHGIEPSSGFRMRPGYKTFQRVAAGEPLAIDNLGSYSATEDGRILMPLYQPLGDDGFFLVREFRRFWLAVSAILRRLRLDVILHWLPGVRRVPTEPGTYIVDEHVARYFAIQVFHLLGFRRKRTHGAALVVSRRKHDLPGT